MTAEDRDTLKLRLMRHEGEVKKRDRHMPYTDTVGKVTIGYGRNLSDRGLSDDESAFLLENDLDDSIKECQDTFPWFGQMNGPRQTVLAEMCFNLGLSKLLGFRTTLSLMMRGEYERAAGNMLKSLWSRQVGQRAQTLAEIMRTGSYV